MTDEVIFPPIEVHLESDNSPDPDLAYDHDALVEGIRAKAKNTSCPVCEADRWFIGGSLNTLLPGLLPGGSVSDAALGVLPWICTNCNFVRFHVNWEPVGEWANQAGAAE